MLYTQDAHGFISALDPGTGTTIWQQEPFARTVEEATGQSTRGVDYWRSGGDQRILAVRGEYLYALNAKTGKIYPDFGDKGRMNLHFTEGQPLAGRFSDTTGPLVVGNVVVVTGNTPAPATAASRRKRRAKIFAASTSGLAGGSGRSMSSRRRGSSATTRGATNHGGLPETSARGTR